MSEVKKLFQELSEDAQYLLGKVVELYECEECCGPHPVSTGQVA